MKILKAPARSAEGAEGKLLTGAGRRHERGRKADATGKTAEQADSKE